MHVVVPTLDLTVMLSKLRPLRSLTTSGFSFPIYTLEAYGDKLRLLIGDRLSITASMEVFAKVKKEGKISVNGADFYENVIRIVPDSKSTIAGSKEIELEGTDTQLKMSTTTYYAKINSQVSQQRSFSRVATDLSVNLADKPTTHQLKMQANNLAEIFRVSSRLISSYTSDMTSLSGILIRVRNKTMYSVVSDGTRILEVTYPQEIESEDFDVILPKITATLLQGIIEDGDEVEMCVDSKRIKFYINSNGLETYLASSIVKAAFPAYEGLFSVLGNKIKLDSRVFVDNITNIRKALNDDTYRVRLVYDGKTLSMQNSKSSSHLAFSNSGVPVVEADSKEFDILINAFLLEGLLTLIRSDTLTLISPPDNKPLILLNNDDRLVIKTAIALASE